MRKRWVVLVFMLLFGSAGAADGPIQQPVAPGTAVAQQVTPDNGKNTAAASPGSADQLVALVLTRPEIKSVSDLAGKNIAVDATPSVSQGSAQRAIAAAGATDVRLSSGPSKALARLIEGDVPAAVLTLAYPEAAEWSSEIAGFKVFRIPLSPPSMKAALEPAGNAAAASNARKIQEQVAVATAFAEKVTAATAVPATKEEASQTDRPRGSGAMSPGDAGKIAPSPPDNTEASVVLVMARPEIKSVSDLSRKVVAIDHERSASQGEVRTAMVAAGASEIQLNDSQTKAVDRLVSGELPAAVLTMVSVEAAEWFPEIKGFKIFRVPLSPRSLAARPEASDDAAVAVHARMIREQVRVATVIAEHVMTLRDAEKIASASPNNSKPLVAILMARLEIKSVSDLTGKIIAIDDRHSVANMKIQTAIAAAGATEVQLNEKQTKAIDRLIGGEVPAAVVSLVYPETGFSEIPGFKIFRIPL